MFLYKVNSKVVEKEILHKVTNEIFKLWVHYETLNPPFLSADPQMYFNFQNIILIGLDNANEKDLYFEVYHFKDKRFYRALYQSETVKHQYNPKFVDFALNKNVSCNADMSNEIKISIFDQTTGFLGEAKILLKSAYSSQFFPIYKEHLKICQIQFNFSEFREISTNDLVNSLKFFSLVGIDFTASNKLITDENSNHYIKTSSLYFNKYQLAINSVQNLLSYYNSFQLIPFYSFGGIAPGNNLANHCCDLNRLYTKNIPIEGVNGLLEVYKDVISTFKLSGPTYFKPLLEYIFTTFINSVTLNPYNYHLIWIFVDGDIDDENETEEILKEANKLGISIIICGIGLDPFDSMKNFIKKN